MIFCYLDASVRKLPVPKMWLKIQGTTEFFFGDLGISQWYLLFQKIWAQVDL